MTAPSLTEFLLARIAEDEAAISEWPTEDRGGPVDMPALRARVLRWCEADRRIVFREKHRIGRAVGRGEEWAYSYSVIDLATVYADHPDYREEWKP